MEQSLIEKILADWEMLINSNPWTPLFPYPFCCICFERLTSKNVLVEGDKLVDVCIDCKDK